MREERELVLGKGDQARTLKGAPRQQTIPLE